MNSPVRLSLRASVLSFSLAFAILWLRAFVPLCLRLFFELRAPFSGLNSSSPTVNISNNSGESLSLEAVVLRDYPNQSPMRSYSYQCVNSSTRRTPV
jgi:hypothetical protein